MASLLWQTSLKEELSNTGLYGLSKPYSSNISLSYIKNQYKISIFDIQLAIIRIIKVCKEQHFDKFDNNINNSISSYQKFSVIFALTIKRRDDE